MEAVSRIVEAVFAEPEEKERNIATPLKDRAYSPLCGGAGNILTTGHSLDRVAH